MPGTIHIFGRRIGPFSTCTKLTNDSANVFAEEMFQENFAKDHTSQAAWDKFRRGILEYGGSRNEREVLEEFLGRPPTTDALLRNLRQGLDASLKDFSKAS